MKSKLENILSTFAWGLVWMFLVIGGMAMVTPSKSFPQVDIPSVVIGEQTWSTENLDVTHFRNGEALFEANSAEAWEKANIEGLPAWCYYENNPTNGKKYGKKTGFSLLMKILPNPSTTSLRCFHILRDAFIWDMCVIIR